MNEDTLKKFSLGKKITSIALLVFFFVPAFTIQTMGYSIGTASAFDFAVGLHTSGGFVLTDGNLLSWLLLLLPVGLIFLAFFGSKIGLEEKITSMLGASNAMLELLFLILIPFVAGPVAFANISLEIPFYLYILLTIAAMVCFGYEAYYSLKYQGGLKSFEVNASTPGAGVGTDANQPPVQPTQDVFCPQCGSATKPGVKFCPKCGHSLN